MAGSIDFSDLSANHSSYVLVDVRNNDEVSQLGRIPGAVNIPIDSVVDTFSLSDKEFKEKVGINKPGKDAPVVTYCLKGGRASKAGSLLTQHGYSNVKIYNGSFSDWMANDGEIFRGDNL